MALDNQLQEYILLKDYEAISKYSFQVDVKELKENKELVSWILKANLETKKYDLNCFFIEKLIRNELESYELYLYLFTSLMKINDYYRIKSYLIKSKLLNDTIMKPIFDGDFTVLSEIGKLSNEDYSFECALLIMVLNDLFDNYDIEKITNEDVMIAYYEMVDQAYSSGIEIERMDTISFIGGLLFEKK